MNADKSKKLNQDEKHFVTKKQLIVDTDDIAVSTASESSTSASLPEPRDKVPPNAIGSQYRLSFLWWLVDTQYFRRDDVGMLSANFGKDIFARTLLFADYAELREYLVNRLADQLALDALEQAYREWCHEFGWYFGNQLEPAPSQS